MSLRAELLCIELDPAESALRKRWRKQVGTLGNIYFVGPRDLELQRVKIGYTAGDVRARLRQMQTGSPFELIIYGYYDGHAHWEEFFHLYFAPFRVHGEWFHVTGELRVAVENLIRHADPVTRRVPHEDAAESLMGPLLDWRDDYPDKARRARLVHIAREAVR